MAETATAYRNRMRRELQAMAGAAGASSPWQNPLGTTANVMDPLGVTARQTPGALNLTRGVSPDDMMLNKFIAMRGGGPKAPKYPIVRSPAAGPNPFPQQKLGAQLMQKPAAPPEPSAFEKLMLAVQGKQDEAFARNEARDQEIRGLMGKYGEADGLYGRTMSEVDNYGKAAKLDLEQRAKEAMGKIQANLSARGLGNSSITSAFEQRNASDLAREQQRLSEMVSERRIGHDQRLTGELTGFIERQEDVAPDMLPYVQLAMQYGQSGEGKAIDELRAEMEAIKKGGGKRGGYKPLTRVPQTGGGFSPRQAAQYQQSMLAAFGGGGGYAAPMGGMPMSYYEVPAGDEGDYYAPTRARQAKEQEAKLARIAKRKAMRAPALPPQHILDALQQTAGYGWTNY